MYTCQECSELLLEYLYDLLEADQAEALRTHLAGCPSCQAVHAQAENQQKLLARAAQVCDKVPIFQAPADEVRSQESGVRSQESEVRKTEKARVLSFASRRWPWVAAAAAVLLLLAGGYGWYQSGLSERQDEVALREKTRRETLVRYHRLRDDLRSIDEQLKGDVPTFQEKRRDLVSRLRSKQLHLQILGPADYQPGSPNLFRIVTSDLNGKPVSAAVTVRVFDSARRSVLLEQQGPSKGEMLLTLPGDLKVQPRTAVFLEIEALLEKTREVVHEELPVSVPSYATQVVLNKSLYRSGEMVFFRTLTLERFSLRPPEKAVPCYYQVTNAAGQNIVQLLGFSRAGDGIGGGEFVLADDLPAGEYTLQVLPKWIDEGMHFLPGTRRFVVVRDASFSLTFDQKTYGPGDTVKAQLRSRPQEKELGFGNQSVSVTAKVDNQPLSVKAGEAKGEKTKTIYTDPKGNAVFLFQLPSQIKSNTAQVEVLMKHGTREEKLLQPIPLAVPGLQDKLNVEFFPEGGELVADVLNRIYFRAHNALGEPAEFEGRIKNARGKEVAVLKTTPEGNKAAHKLGLGAFTLIPEVGQTYTLQITVPKGNTAPLALPPVRDKAVALSVPTGVTAAGEPIRMALSHAGADRPVLVAAFCRGRLVDQQLVTAKRPITEVKLTPAAGTHGVVRLTVFEIAGKQLVPLAERLVYRLPAERLQLEVQGDKQSYQPGQKVELTVKTKDESGAPVSAWLLAAVVDAQSLLSADKQAVWGLPADFYLTSELHQPEDLEQADFLLREDGQAHKALDLFLGTHGWRRFVQPTPGKVVGEPSRLVMLAEEQTAVLNHDNLAQAEKRLTEALKLAQDKLLADAISRRLRLREEREAQETSANLLAKEVDSATQSLQEATRELNDYRTQVREALRAGGGILVLFLCSLGGLFLILGFVRLARRRVATTYLATAFTSLLLCLVLAYALTQNTGPASHRGPAGTGDTERLLAVGPPPDLAPLSLGKAPATEKTSKEASVLVFAPSAAKEKGDKSGAKLKVDETTPSELATWGLRGRKITDKATARADMKKTTHGPEIEKRMSEAKQAQAKEPAEIMMELHYGYKQTGGLPAKGGGADGATASTYYRQQPVREYAHKHFKGGVDSQETVLWHPALLAENGSITIPPFDLSDNATTYCVLLYGHTATGRLGIYQGWLEAKK
jgi:hypothetical protein